MAYRKILEFSKLPLVPLTPDILKIEECRVLHLTQFLVLIGKAYQYQGDAHGVRSVRLEGTGRDLPAVA